MSYFRIRSKLPLVSDSHWLGKWTLGLLIQWFNRPIGSVIDVNFLVETLAAICGLRLAEISFN